MKALLKPLIGLVLVAGLASSVGADDNSFRVRLGIFTPEGDSQYWDEKALDFDFEGDDLEDFQFGLDYDLGLTGNSLIRFSFDSYSGEERTRYLDFVDNDGFFIEHDTTLDLASVTAAFIFELAPARAPIAPYLGAGGGIYLWELVEDGDFIDFLSDDLEVFSGAFGDEGVAFGYFLTAGVEFRFNYRNAFFVEGRWHDVDDNLEEDFEGFGDLDLSGLAIHGGYAWKF